MVEEKRKYQAYYTNSSSIVSYMVNLLELSGSERILEPCAGDGIFLDKLIKDVPKASIDALELNGQSFNNLKSKYNDYINLNIKETDFLYDEDLDFYSSMGGIYDAVIANPPYGAWRNTEERKSLKKKFNGFYSKESYTLFLAHSINLLKDGGRLSFIMPDTWLTVHMHKLIRKNVLTSCLIHEISLFPSSFFPGVNFGYANLMIISLEKSSKREICLNNEFCIYSGFKSVEELGNNKLEHVKQIVLTQNEVLKNADYSFAINTNQKVLDCIKSNGLKIGDICNCVTGFYSGNDKSFLKVINKDIKNGKRYDVVDVDNVEYNCSVNDLEGLNTKKLYVPIVKGGNTKYWKSDIWFMSWTKENVEHYKGCKKARYQNSNFYFKKGIGIPMVSSSSISAVLLDNRLFDQSIVGVFPTNEQFLYYLLAFFNSPTCNVLIRTINSTTNNSSNYIKKIPFVEPSEAQLKEISLNVKSILQNVVKNGNFQKEIEDSNNSIIHNIYGF